MDDTKSRATIGGMYACDYCGMWAGLRGEGIDPGPAVEKSIRAYIPPAGGGVQYMWAYICRRCAAEKKGESNAS